MYPTLVDRDYVALLSNVFYSGSDIQNGDVVVALAPRFDDEPIVKRVIATAGGKRWTLTLPGALCM